MAVDESCSISKLLGSCLLACRRLRLKEFETWVKQELDGFTSPEVPDYRMIRTDLRGWNMVHGWIPFEIPTSEVEEILLHYPIREPASNLEELLRSSQGRLNMGLTADERNAICDLFPQAKGRELVRFVSRSQVAGIIDAVRRNVLEWALRLEDEGVLGEGMTFTREEKQVAKNITYNIGSMQGIAGDVDNSTVHQQMHQQVRQGDIQSLRTTLREIGVPEAGITALEKAIQEDRAAGEGYGTKVKVWIGELAGKVASGAVSAAILTPATVAINAYFGVP